MAHKMWFSFFVGISEANGSRLTPLQLRIRDKLGNVPKRYRRSIDAFHVALGRPPLWDDTPALKSTGDWSIDEMRRKYERERKRIWRKKRKEAKDGR
jgi:hypothetical protein